MNCDCGSKVSAAVDVAGGKMKLTDFLNENLDSHSVVISDDFAKELREATGMQADWRTESYAKIRARLKAEARGGWLSKECKGKRLASAVEIVEALGYKYVPGFESCRCYNGLGKMYYSAFGQLVKAGL
jgi:hypothetical protein